ncbi:MAG TPA: prepilin-type N-terminal cleavage/methylation domain-containing protein [Solirubrobacteraceae bacterium]|jgi:prepilin-type N-terminal cleavage/methylation domain-containing protein
MRLPRRASIRDAHGFTLIELLVAMSAGLIVVGALLAILDISLKQTQRISDRVQVDRSGRTAMNNVLEELHSSCTGFGATAIQAPSTTPVSPLAAIGTSNLWFLSAYGNSTSSSPAVSAVVQHDINWTATGTSGTGEQLGTLRDYSFTGSGESPNWAFPTLTTTNATSRVLAKNVIPLSTSTLFHYYRYETTSTSSEYGKLVEVGASELASVAENEKIAKVEIAYRQAPEKGDTREGHTTTFSGSAVLRLTPPESASEGFTCT